MDSDPDLRPERMGLTDPARTEISSAAAHLEAWEPPQKKGRRDEQFILRRSPPDAGGSLFLSFPPWPRYVLAGFDAAWFASPERLQQLAAWFQRLSEAMDAYYGRVAFSTVLRQEQALRQAARRAGTIHYDRGTGSYFVDERGIPDVSWLNYFGPATVEKWGSSRLDGLGVRQEATANGGRVIWATETPFVHDPNVTAMTEYAWKRPFYDALDLDTFIHEGWQDPGPGVRVPSFEEHRLATIRTGGA